MPQYWAMSTPPPEDSPKLNIIKIKNGWPPSEAPEMAISPRLPSMTLSMMLTPKLMMFCSAMGMAMAATDL